VVAALRPLDVIGPVALGQEHEGIPNPKKTRSESMKRCTQDFL
jgi:hypothetical protein